MPIRDEGLRGMLADLQKEADASGVYVTEYVNDSDAAVFLQARDGYFVFNDQRIADGHQKALTALGNSPEPLTRERVIENQKGAARDVVAFHKHYAGGTKPPLRKGGPRRPIRAGAWADRRGVTADSYEAFVESERVKVDDIQPVGQDLR